MCFVWYYCAPNRLVLLFYIPKLISSDLDHPTLSRKRYDPLDHSSYVQTICLDRIDVWCFPSIVTIIQLPSEWTQKHVTIIKEITNKSDFHWAYFRSFTDIINPAVFPLVKLFNLVQLFFLLMKEYALNERKKILLQNNLCIAR